MSELISVIVPVYNVEKYLSQCVDSLLKQTYNNLEIILVDDGSTDASGDMCEKYKLRDFRIKVIHKKNGGLSDARNKGIDMATGDFFAFVDSDDYVPEDYYEILYNALKRENADISACDIAWVYENRCEYPLPRYDERVYTPKEALNTLIHGEGFCAVAWNKLYKKELFKDIRYPVGKLHEDEFVTYKLLGLAKRLALTQKCAYFYRQRSGSIMNKSCIERTCSFDAFFERLDYLRENYYSLYVADKATICIALVSHYRKALLEKDVDTKTLKSKLKAYRKKLRFPIKELKNYSLKQKIYIIFSAHTLGAFCTLLNIKRIGD